MRLIPLNSAKEGIKLGKTLYDVDGRVLLRQGVELNSGLLKKVKDNEINTIYINDEFSQNEIEDMIKPELKNRAIKTIKDTFDNIAKADLYNRNKTKSAQEKAKEVIRENMTFSIKKVSESIVDEVFTNKNILINLVDIKNMDNYTYQHSVNVAILSLVVGMELGMNKVELNNLCLGALLHDIGKVFVDKDILSRPINKLTAEELGRYKDHTVLGYNYLKDSVYINPTARIVILQHHERIDRSGYPNRLDSTEISKLSKIVAVTDIYDELTSDIPGKKALPPNEAMEFIMGSAGRYFDFETVQVFARKVIPYPEGTMIRLSNGEIAVVDEVNLNYPLRPKVKIIEHANGNLTVTEMDLMKHTNVTISGVEYNIDIDTAI